MKSKTLYMETTEIPADKTAGEITSCLRSAGAVSVITKFDANRITGLGWAMTVSGNEVHFTMPARVEPVYKILLSRNRKTWLTDKEKASIRARAERVAWRQLLRWTQAQLAMIETGMVKPAEVFMPYMTHADGSTFFEYFENKQLQITAGDTKAATQ